MPGCIYIAESCDVQAAIVLGRYRCLTGVDLRNLDISDFTNQMLENDTERLGG